MLLASFIIFKEGIDIMNDNYIYVLLRINKKNGGVEMIKSEKKLMKEINKVYKDLKIEKKVINVDKSNINFSKKIGIYDNNKKSYLDNKTSVRARYGYYGGLE